MSNPKASERLSGCPERSRRVAGGREGAFHRSRVTVLSALLAAGMTVVAGSAHAAVSATGGDAVYIYTTNGTTYRAHVYTNTSPTNLVVISGPGDVEYLIVAGGGGGGGNASGGGGGGGGGAGGCRTGTTYLTAGTYNIVVGSGGAGGVAGANGTTGKSGTN